jgi:hypothetical protein
VANKLNYAIAFTTIPVILYMLYFQTWTLRFKRDDIKIALFGLALLTSICSFLQFSIMNIMGRSMIGKFQELLNLNLLFLVGIYYI